MNKFQLAVLWLGAIALSVYLCMKQEMSYYIASAGFLALAGIITFYGTRRQEHEHYGAPKEKNGQKPVLPDAAVSAFPHVILPGPFSRGAVVFKKESVEYNGKTYYYKNMTGMFYNTVKLVVHGIPSSQTYTVGFKSTEGGALIQFSSALFINNDKLSGLYEKLVGLACEYIQPQIIEKMMREMFKNGGTVKVGGLEFTNKGYSRKKLFGGVEFIEWKSKVYLPQLHEGYVYVYRDKKDKPQVMKTLSMQAMNAVILPLLVQLCYDEANKKQG